VGAITDDTQMALFTAEGLLRAHVRAQAKGIEPAFASVTANAYLRWLATQGRKPRVETLQGSNDGPGNGWLIQVRELHDQRAPGLTCISALEAMPALGAPARNSSKGSGGVMRVAPVGLFVHSTLANDHGTGFKQSFEIAVELAAITHGHATGQLTAGAFALIVYSLAAGQSLWEAVGHALGTLQHRPGYEETLNAIERAQRVARSRMTREQAIHELGEGWVAEEALAIAIYCALVAESFEDGVILAVNHSGDSDSTGSITGNLLGAMHGDGAIPPRWLAEVELREVIGQVADDLREFPSWKIGDGVAEGTRHWERYPGF
jgi:ADP-ribosylglycohydrolase